MGRAGPRSPRRGSGGRRSSFAKLYELDDFGPSAAIEDARKLEQQLAKKK